MKAESLRELIGEPVKVVWLDTVSRSEWTTLAKVTAMQPHICVTFGLLMVVTDTHLTLAATSCKPEEDDDDVASDCITLPIGGIAQVTRMTEQPRSNAEVRVDGMGDKVADNQAKGQQATQV